MFEIDDNLLNELGLSELASGARARGVQGLCQDDATGACWREINRWHARRNAG